MATSYGNPPIVTDGLVLCLDAANSLSYPGSGTSWNDLSGQGNSGTLINGPTFNPSNGGSIVFDGTNDYASCGNPPELQINQGTISAWTKSSNPGSSFRGIIVKQYNYGLFFFDGILVTYDWAVFQTRNTLVNIADGRWKNVAMSFTLNTGSPSNNAVIYINGIPVLTTTLNYNNNGTEVQIASGGFQPPDNTMVIQQLNGNVSNVSIYNRALSASEVLQNYEATKTRFGL
jgi:hypothetical protein